MDRLLSKAYVTWSHNSIDESLTMEMSNWPINWSLFPRDHSKSGFSYSFRNDNNCCEQNVGGLTNSIAYSIKRGGVLKNENHYSFIHFTLA